MAVRSFDTDDDEEDDRRAVLAWRRDHGPSFAGLPKPSTASRPSTRYGHEDVRVVVPETPKTMPPPVIWNPKKFTRTSRAYWEKELTDVKFRMVGGEALCLTCSGGEFDCRCDPNPFVERAMKADPLLRKYGIAAHGHSIFAASGSDGWMGCEAYALVNARFPGKATEYAAYGTVAHEIASDFLDLMFHGEGKKALPWWPEYWEKRVEKVLLNRNRKADGFAFTIDRAMLAACWEHVEKCIGDSAGADEVVIERRVDYSRYMPIPRQGGTLDFAALRSKVCIVDDAKFGEGVKVFAKENKQVLGYCVAVIEEWDHLYDFQEFTIRINQPRMNHFDTWECDRATVLRHAEEMRDWSHRGWKEDAPRTPGPKTCRWCADFRCLARKGMSADKIASGFDPIEDDGLGQEAAM